MHSSRNFFFVVEPHKTHTTINNKNHKIKKRKQITTTRQQARMDSSSSVSPSKKSKSSIRTIDEAFAISKSQNRAAFIPYITAGFPTLEATVPLLLTLQEAGADIIELGFPHSDPLADGPVIQKSSHEALLNGVKLSTCFKYVQEARDKGLVVPVIIMGYVNPFLSYGEEQLAKKASEVGVQGFIIVDLPPDDAASFTKAFDKYKISFVPLVAPTTTDARLEILAKLCSGYVYAVSLTGVTGQRAELSAQLPTFLGRIKKHFGEIPIAVGFGLSSNVHVRKVYELGASGAVVGSSVITAIRNAPPNLEDQKVGLSEFVKSMMA